MEPNIDQIISAAIDRLNEILATGEPLPKDKSTILLGDNAALDSMGFVNLVLAVEEEIDRELGVKVLLADHMANTENIAWSIGDLHVLLLKLVRDAEAKRGG